jgi:hypothetical protein
VWRDWVWWAWREYLWSLWSTCSSCVAQLGWAKQAWAHHGKCSPVWSSSHNEWENLQWQDDTRQRAGEPNLVEQTHSLQYVQWTLEAAKAQAPSSSAGPCPPLS